MEQVQDTHRDGGRCEIGKKLVAAALLLFAASAAAYLYGVPPATPGMHPQGYLTHIYRDYALPLALAAVLTLVAGLYLDRKAAT